MSAVFVDTHLHLDLPEFDADREAVIDRATSVGVVAFVLIGFNPQRWESTAELMRRHPSMVRAVGLHPNNASEWTDGLVSAIAREAQVVGTVAIGEIGLDYFRDHADPTMQRAAFVAQIRLARELDLPVVIHQREAEDDVLELLAAEGPVRGVMHCFSGDAAFAHACLDLGMYLGIGGVATYKRSDAIREAIRTAPLERLVLETDAPYLAPQRRRGHRNEPALMIDAAETLALLKEVEIGQVAAATTRNAVDLFGPALNSAVGNGKSTILCE